MGIRETDNGLTQKYIKESFLYNKNTGELAWKYRPRHHFKTTKGMNVFNSKYSGSIAGGLDSQGYIKINILGEKYQSHRLIWIYVYGYSPENEIDHKDKDKSNNKIDNLRHVTHGCNMQNRKRNKNNITGVTGVVWEKRRRKYKSEIKIKGNAIRLGLFKNFNDAVIARYNEEVSNKDWSCSICSDAYSYLKKHNLI